jgi:hypothetical protein
MSSNNENNFEIPLTLTDELKNSGIIQKFVKNTKQNYTELGLNSKYEECNMIFPTLIIRSKKDDQGWIEFKELVRKELRRYGISTEHINQILTVLTRNYKLISEVSKNNNSDTENQQEQGQGKPAEQKIKVAELLLEIFNELDPKPVLFKDQFKVPHVLVNIDGHYKILQTEDPKFRQYLTILYYDSLGEIPNSTAIESVVQYLAAKSTYDKNNTISLHLRAAWSNNQTRNELYYHMSDEKNRSVKITSSGWTILENQTDVLFREYDHQVPQVEPILFGRSDSQDDPLNDFIELFNIKNKNDRLLLKCYIISLFIPDFPNVVLILLGEQGGSKSTLQELVRSLVDPSILKNLAFPPNESEFAIQLSHNYTG